MKINEDGYMTKSEKFFFTMAWFLLGIFVGIVFSPIKEGINITIASNNVGDLPFLEDDDDDDDDEDEIEDDPEIYAD